MNAVNKTLYIPLYGKAQVSRKGIILHDPWAERIWEAEGFALRGKSRSRWLAYYMGMRAAVMDGWVRDKLEEAGHALVLHIGCGMDSRAMRIGKGCAKWIDVDFPAVIAERSRYYEQSDTYAMLGADASGAAWVEQLPDAGRVIVVMEGLSMYLTVEQMRTLLTAIGRRYARAEVIMDCYTQFAAKASKYKNPVNDVGAGIVSGVDDPQAYAQGTGFSFAEELNMTPDTLIDQLCGWERAVFKKVFAGRFAKGLYRIYTYRSEQYEV